MQKEKVNICTSYILGYNFGPNIKQNIPLEVYDDNGNISKNLETVLNKWKIEYESLFTFQTEPGAFDDGFC